MSRILDRRQIQQVVVILAGSRTGSTFLFDQLSSTGKFLCPQGEETPYYRLAGIGNFSGELHSDEIHTLPEVDRMDEAGTLLLKDSGKNDTNFFDMDLFEDQVLFRAGIRYPDLSFAEETQARRVVKEFLCSFARNRRTHWPESDEDSYEGLWSDLSSLQVAFAPNRHQFLRPLIEDTPYVNPVPKCPVRIEEIETVPLLLKSSSNCFRLPLLRAMYPNAKFRWIVLKRNPAATLSALIDGWQSDFFHSYLLPETQPLCIPGYTDRKKFGDRYWKFDLPPGWQSYRNTDLQEVAAFQLSASMFAIQSFLESTHDPIHEIHYEDLLGQDAQARLRSLFHFSLNRKTETPVFPLHLLSATVSPPQREKWKKREKEIVRTLYEFEEGKLLLAAKAFNYNIDRMEEWI